MEAFVQCCSVATYFEFLEKLPANRLKWSPSSDEIRSSL